MQRKCTLSSALSSFYFDDLQRVPPFISWLRYLSFNYHTYRLLLKVQYDPVPDILTTTAHMDNGVTEVAALVAMIIGYQSAGIPVTEVGEGHKQLANRVPECTDRILEGCKV
jgi:hypothetical protein